MNKFVIGLILGVLIAGGLAYYLNNMPSPFVNKVSNTVNANGKLDGSPIILAPSTKLEAAHNQSSSSVISGSSGQASAPNYDFYDILQGRKASSNSLGKSLSKETVFYVQAGTFDSQDGANDMKAQLALLGIDAKIKSQKTANKIINKIVIGPFGSATEADKIMSQLSDNNIHGNLVKIVK